MSEEHFDRLEKMMEQTQAQMTQMQAMMEQLVKMVGHNNAVTEELRQRMDGLDKHMDNLETEIKSLKESDAAIIELVQQSYRSIEKKIEEHVSAIREDFKSVAEITGDHEIRIRTLTRRPV